ncbi:DUF3987 domain-containing protein [Hyphomonas sp. WL0036]|uniref:DUF3987 domain-containing protein n=1 Tax=Hyphomonas sediminis TaxID=2866160 RepID=UPI001C826573|nr:DUF3987 domain-containing protein [Hyphomonas sediminis]MBY9067629.1 DUF3987 domain-containing protein [Hyphomonas sediminis]
MIDAYRKSAAASAARDYSGQSDANGDEAWPVPDWSVLGGAMADAPCLPLECFGKAAEYIRRAAEGTNAPPDYVAGMLIAAVSGLVCKSVSVRINRSWYEDLILWLALIGPPSSGKTPAAKAIRKRLFAIQKKMVTDHEAMADQMIADLKANSLAGSTAKEDKAANKLELERLEALRLSPPRCLVNDATVEALASVEASAAQGLLVERDELTGLICALERYSAGSDRPFYLEAWMGGPFQLDRVKYGSKLIERHGFSIVGGIQPDRYRSLLTMAGDDDGFAARLLPFWPVPVKPASIPEGTFHDEMDEALERIAAQKFGEYGLTLTLASNAFEAFDDWYGKDHSARVGKLGKAGSAYGKLPGYVARLAGVLHIMDWAFSKGEAELPTSIEEIHVTAALALVEDYFVPQIRRVYHGADLSAEESIAAAILQHCRKLGLASFNVRDARREWEIPGARSKDATKLFDDAVKLIVESGWARAVRKSTRAKVLEVNPVLHAGGKP